MTNYDYVYGDGNGLSTDFYVTKYGVSNKTVVQGVFDRKVFKMMKEAYCVSNQQYSKEPYKSPKTRVREELEKYLFLDDELPIYTEDYVLNWFLNRMIDHSEEPIEGGVGIDKLSIRCDSKYITNNQRAFSSNSIVTILRRGKWAYINIHAEAFRKDIAAGQIIFMVLKMIDSHDVFTDKLSEVVEDMEFEFKSIREVLVKFFQIGGFELCFDFGLPTSELVIPDTFDQPRMFKNIYYSKDFDQVVKKVRNKEAFYRINKSLIAIYDRGQKIGYPEEFNLTRFEIRMERKYLRTNRFESTDYLDWDFISRPVLSLAKRSRVQIAKAIETSMKKRNKDLEHPLKKVYYLIEKDKQYRFLKWLIEYSYPDFLYKK